MHKKTILSDTSVLIALSNINQLEILKKIFGTIIITQEVNNEFGEDIPEWITIESVSDITKIDLLKLELDEGEASSIALALEKRNSLLIIDERKGRIVAKKMGLSIIGLLGVLVRAKELQIIKSLKPIIGKLQSAGFRISNELILKILNKVDED